jgi:hypothetical protein
MNKTQAVPRVFDTDKRIRLGIWGLGRGMSFFRTCKFLNIDVVAGCDFNEHMRTNFLTQCPGAFVTADEDEFLKQDFDAVLLATYCLAHGPHAVRCLQAGKHVMSEVTSFFTMAEGVKLVEEVERRGRVYNLAENYPFSAANMWLANRWREGLFDIYGGCDVTIPGIQALRSATEGGKPMEVPDFRKKEDRDRYRHDDWRQER